VARARPETFGSEGVFAVLLGDDSGEVVGLVPNGVTQVTITGADGARSEVAVKHNVIRVPLADANQVSFAIDGEPVSRDLAPAS
jgi:hypothetical protein